LCYNVLYNKGAVVKKFIIYALFTAVLLGKEELVIDGKKVTIYDSQIAIAKKVYAIGKNYKDKRGESFEKTLTAISLTESSLGVYLVGDITKNRAILSCSFGVMQIQLGTAKDVINRLFPELFPEMRKINDYVLLNKIAMDPLFSAKISALYLTHLSNTRKSYFSTVSGYNGGFKNIKYYRKVMENMRIIKAMERKGILS
jgi:hypothetical protein